jgi:hypothetical protein
MATDAPALQPESGLFMPRFLRLIRRFPLSEPTILNPYRSVIQEVTNNRHESRGSPGGLTSNYTFLRGWAKNPNLAHGKEKAALGLARETMPCH